MTKILYAYENTVELFNGNYYHSHLNSFINRYLYLGNKITCLVNVKNRKSKEELSQTEKINTDFLQIVPIVKINTVKKLLTKTPVNKRIIKREVIYNDIIIARLPSIIGEQAIHYAKKKSKPYIVEVVGCPWDSLWNHSFRGRLIAPIRFYFTRKYVYNAPFVHYVTQNFLQKRYPTKGYTLGCSDVSLPELSEDVLSSRLQKIDASHSITNLATTAAVDVKFKGQEYVIQALGFLKKEGYIYHYYLIGGGNPKYLYNIAQQCNVENQVHFLGDLPHDEVFNYLDSIDLYVQPSKQEGLPRAVVEAMSRGCPTIGSSIAGIPELLNKECLFKKGSVKQISSLLKSYTKKRMKQEAIRNFNYAKTFQLETLNKKREKFYNYFLEQNKIIQ